MVVVERKLIQEALRRKEAYLAEAQRLTHTGSWAYDPSIGETTYWSEELFRIFGLDPQQGLPTSQTFWERIHSDDRDGVNTGIQKALREKAECVLDYRILLPDGMLKHIHSVTHPVVSQSGEVVELVGTAVDVTERKHAEEALRRSEAHLAEAQRLTGTGSWVRSAKGDVYWSEEMFRIWGFDPMQRPPDRDSVLQRVHPDDRDRTRENSDAAMRGGTGIDQEYRIVLPEGTVRNIHAVGRPILSASGDLIEMIGTVVDVTERKRAQEERERLRQLEANLAHMNRVSVVGELSASLAHELNQPITAAMTSAKTCSGWLSGENPNLEKARQAAKRIVNDTKRAGDIISHTRSLFKKGIPQRELVNINDVIEEIATLLEDEARQWHVSIRRRLEQGLPLVLGNRVQLQQVVMNLIVNSIDAMKAIHDTREIIVTSKISGDYLLVSVEDTGPGLPAAPIFDAFVTTKPHGTGMGLAISRTIIESHGGRLCAESNSPKGAIFRFTVPLVTETQQ